MPRQKKDSLPKLRRDRGIAFCEYNGQRHRFGRWGSSEAQEAYNRFRISLLEGNLPVPAKKEVKLPAEKAVMDYSGVVLTVAELVEQFFDYLDKRGLPDRERSHWVRALGFLVDSCAIVPVDRFSRKNLHSVRNKMVEVKSLCRGMINKYVRLIVRVFDWGVDWELVPEEIVGSISRIKGLREGEFGVRDNPPREHVPDPVVARTLPYCTPTESAMIQVERLTGMRPEELCLMTVGNFDRPAGSDLWYYRLDKHKTVKKTGKRIIVLGKPEQELIAPYLVGKKPENAIFSPRTSDRERKMENRANRKTKVPPSQKERDKRNAKKPSNVGEFYCPDSYRRAITYAIKRANRDLPADAKLPSWTPYQLRHGAATAARKKYGRDGAKALLGHVSGDVTDRYTHEWQFELCEKMARERVNPFAKNE